MKVKRLLWGLFLSLALVVTFVPNLSYAADGDVPGELWVDTEGFYKCEVTIGEVTKSIEFTVISSESSGGEDPGNDDDTAEPIELDDPVAVTTGSKTFTFTPEEDGNYIFASEGAEDTYGTVTLDGEEIASDDDTGEDSNFQLCFEAKAGLQQVEGQDSDSQEQEADEKDR